MTETLEPTRKPTATSPCVGICALGADGLCLGCRRTLDEIARWSRMTSDERRRWIQDVQPTRSPSPLS